MNRTRAVLAVGTLVALLVAGCSKSEEATPTTRATSTTHRTVTTITTATTCDESDPINDDDVPAEEALLTEPQLPPGRWTTRISSACRWLGSSQDLLLVPQCRKAAGLGARTDRRTGNAKESWVRTGGTVQLDQRSELYPSPRMIRALRPVLTNARPSDCLEAALQRQAAEAPNTKIAGVKIRTTNDKVSAAALGLEWLGDATISMTLESKGQHVPVAIRFVSLAIGGGLSTVVLTGSNSPAGRADFEAIDLAPTIRAAANRLRASFGLAPR